MNENETLREQMWDLCYGLLSADEVAALHKQIKSDPMAARLYAEVRLQADLVASAAKVEDASVTLSVPDEGRKVQPAAKSHSGAGESPFKTAKSSRSSKHSLAVPSYRAANWLAGLAATALLALIGYGFMPPARQAAAPSDNMVVASVYSEGESLQSGLSHTFRLVARNPRGEPASTEVTYMISHPNGNVTLRDMVQTDERGEAQLDIPGSAIQPGAVLELQAKSDKKSGSQKDGLWIENDFSKALAADSPKVVVPLAAREEPLSSDVQFEKESYRPGETFRFWVHAWSAFSNQPALPADDYKLVAEDGREIRPAVIEARPEAGIVFGEIPLPADATAGTYRFVGVDRKADKSVYAEGIAVGADADHSGVFARRSGMASNTRQLQVLGQLDALAMSESAERAKQQRELAMPMAKGKADMARGGGFPPAPAPGATVPPRPSPPAEALPGVAAAPAPAPPGPPVAGGAPQQLGFAKNGLAEKRDEKGEQSKSELQDRGEITALELRGDALVVQVPAELAHANLFAVVRKGNIQVASQQYHGQPVDDAKATKLESAQSKTATNSPAPAPATEPAAPQTEGTSKVAENQQSAQETTRLSLQLPPEADGDLDVTLYDQSVQPPQQVYRQLVRRASSRELNIDVKEETVAIAPQQELRIKLTATDQNGKAVPNSYFTARLVRADAAAALATASPPANRYAAGDKSLGDGSRGRSMAPGGGGGFGGGSNKGAAEKFAEAKEGKKYADKNESGDRVGLEKEKEAKMAKDTPAKPGELAGTVAPTPAGPGGVEKLANSISAAPQDTKEQLREEDRAVRDGRVSAFSDELLAAPPAMPREVLLGSNDSLIQDAVRAEEVAAQVAEASFQRMIGRAVLVVAAAVLLLFGLLAILHRPAQAKVWVPAMAVVAGSFAVGSVWLMNGNFAQQVAGHVAEMPTSAKHYTEDFKPMALAPKSPRLAVGKDESPAEVQLEKSSSGMGGGIGPTVELPGGFGAGSGAGGGGIGGPAIKKEVAAKPADPAPRAGEPNSDKPKLRAEEDEKKQSGDRKGNEPSFAETAKDAVETKKSGGAPTPQKPAAMRAMKSIAADAQFDKRAKSPNLLWQPNLPADEKGEAELNIQLPAEAGDYYLLVDVQGPNGVGMVQKLIPVRVPAAPAAPAAQPADKDTAPPPPPSRSRVR